MLIDTHCHLDAQEFALDRPAELASAKQVGVNMIVVPTIGQQNFQQVMALSAQYPQCVYALGWHPMYINAAQPSDMVTLHKLVMTQMPVDPRLVAIGEIGLDMFLTKHNLETQAYYFNEQLKIAREFNLPVIVHSRRAVDEVLKYLRRIKVCGGIAHAFNGSEQQAEAFAKLGFKLGFGGAMTYNRALKIRALAKNLDLDWIVLETDAPDIPPQWLGHQGRNSPKELMKIAEVLAEIRGVSIAQIIEITRKNSLEILPRLATLCTTLDVLH